MNNLRKVIVIDDDEVFRIMISMMVVRAELDPSPICLSNGQEAIDYLLENLPDSKNTLLLLDLNMPIVDGWDFLEYAKNHQYLHAYPVVIVSSSTDEREIVRAKSFPQVIKFMCKPVSRDSMKELALQLTAS